MKNLKKVLALGLSATMVSSMFVTAGAAFTDQKDIKAGEAVNMLSALGVINGYEDGSYKPETVVTRAEMAKMIFVVRNNKVDDSAYENLGTKFADIKGHWAAGYIKFCESQGIIAGKTATQFDPDSPVTGVEAAKMLLVLTGYTQDKAGLTGSMWATNTLRFAAEAGILDDVDSPLNSGLPRQYAAQEIYNTLDAYRVKWSNDSNSFDYFIGSGNTKETVGKKYMNLTTQEGTLTSISKENLTVTDGSDTVSFSKLKEDYSKYLGQKVKVMYKGTDKSNVLGVYATSDNTVYNAVMNDVKNDNGKIKFGGTSYSVEGIKVYVNGQRLSKKNGSTSNFSVADFHNAAGTKLINGVYYAGTSNSYANRAIDNRVSADEVIFADTDDNGKIDTAIVTTVDVVKVTYVSSSEIVAGTETYKFADENIAEDIKKDDYAAVRYNSYKDCQDIVKAEHLTGVKVNGEKTGPTKLLLDNTWYIEGANASLNSVKAGNTVNAYVVNGVVYYAKRTTGENATLSDVAVVLAQGTDIQGDKVKILKLNSNTTEIVDVESAPDTNVYVAKGALTVGAAYEYSIKSGKYVFNKALDQTNDAYGDYTALNNGAPANVSVAGMLVGGNVAGNDKTIAGAKVDDSAKIVLITGYAKSADIDHKVITGKQLKSLAVNGAKAEEIFTNGGIAAFTSKVSGVNRVTYAVVAVNGLADSFTTNDNYGYITSEAYKIDGGYMAYTVWTGTEKVQVQEKGTDVGARKKGVVIGYSSIKDDNGTKTIEDVVDAGLTDGSIHGVSMSGGKVNKISVDGTNLNEITNDTKVLFVDTDDHKGYTDGTIQEADEYEGIKINNVMYKLDGSGDADVDVLVVDIKNNLKGKALNAAKAQVASNAKIAAAVAQLKNNFSDAAGTKVAPLAKIQGSATLDGATTVTGAFASVTDVAVSVALASDVTGVNVTSGAKVAPSVSMNDLVLTNSGTTLTTGDKVGVKITLTAGSVSQDVYALVTLNA